MLLEADTSTQILNFYHSAALKEDSEVFAFLKEVHHHHHQYIFKTEKGEIDERLP